MAEGYEVAKGVVTLIPSMRGSQEIITKELTGAADGAGKSAGKTMGEGMSAGLESSGDSVGKQVAGIVAGVVASAAAIGAAFMAAFKEVDAGLDTIRVKTGASGAQMDNMKTSMENLATSIPTSFEDAGAAIGEVNTRFKLTGQGLEDLSGQFIKFAKLNNTDVSTAVDNVSKVINAFGMEAEETGNFLDALNVVGQNTGVDMNTLATTLSQNAAQLQAMGLSAYDAANFLGSCDVAGLEISTTMTGLKTAMKNASKDGKTLDDFLSDFSDTMNSNASESEKLSAAYETFGTRAGGAIYNAVKNGQIDLENLTDSLGDFEGSVDSTFESVTDPVDEYTEAMNRMKIAGADIAEAVMPVVAGAVEGIAGIIGGFSDFVHSLTEPRSELESFISDINKSISDTKEAVEASTERVGNVTESVSELQAYRDIIMDLNEKSELNEFEQYQMKNAVEALSGSMPELANAFNEVTGKLDLTNTELEDMFDNSLKLAMQEAIIEEIKAAYDTMAQSELDAKKASDALATAQTDSGLKYDEVKKKVDALANAGVAVTQALTQEELEVYQAGNAQARANEAWEETNQVMGENVEQLKRVAEEQGAAVDGNVMQAESAEDLASAEEQAAEATEEMKEAAGITAADLESLAESTGLSVDELNRMAESGDYTVEELEEIANGVADARNAFSDLQENVQEATKNSISYLDEFEEKTATTADAMANNLGASNTYASDWVSNMETLGQAIGDMSGKEQEAFQQLYDDMLEQGPEKAGEAAKAMASALSENKGDFDRVVSEYSKTLDLSADSAKLAQYSSTGKAVTGEIAKGVETGSADVVDAAGQMTADVTSEVETGMTEAEAAFDGSMATMEASVDTSANTIESRFTQMVSAIKKTLSETVKGPNIQLPHFKMTGAFDAKTNKVPVVTVDWYGKGAIFTQPTIFETRYGFKGVGESGAEAVLPIDMLRNYIEDAISTTGPAVNVAMTVNGAENPTLWAAQFARTLKQQMRIG